MSCCELCLADRFALLTDTTSASQPVDCMGICLVYCYTVLLALFDVFRFLLLIMVALNDSLFPAVCLPVPKPTPTEWISPWIPLLESISVALIRILVSSLMWALLWVSSYISFLVGDFEDLPSLAMEVNLLFRMPDDLPPERACSFSA